MVALISGVAGKKGLPGQVKYKMAGKVYTNKKWHRMVKDAVFDQ
jgi:hypothetical protein